MFLRNVCTHVLNTECHNMNLHALKTSVSYRLLAYLTRITIAVGQG
jgi:hypothetical protein